MAHPNDVAVSSSLRQCLKLERLEDRAVPAVTGFTGGNQPFDNHQPSLGLNYIIAIDGIFPTRPNLGSLEAPALSSSSVGEEEPFLGEIMLFAGAFAPDGWAFADGTVLPINQHTELFSLLGTSFGGNGQSTFALPDLRGRAAMNAVSTLELGTIAGSDDVTLNTAQLPAHSHTLPGGATGSSGQSMAFDNRQPVLGLNYIINTGTGIFQSLSSLRLVAWNDAPPGWAIADGSLLPITQNSQLFSLLGFTYGGDGQTSFALPDLRGRIAVGTGAGIGLPVIQAGDQFGIDQVNLTLSQLPRHDHTVPGGTTGTTGNNEHIDNSQASLGIHYLIAVHGIHPALALSGTILSSAGVESPIIASVIAYAGDPNSLIELNNWLPADGRLLAINQYQELFGLLGNNYGGDGQTTFALPNLRGRVAVGVGDHPDHRAVNLGEQFGLSTVTLTVAELPSHSHSFVPALLSPPSSAPRPPVQPLPNSAVKLLAVGAGAGAAPHVRVFNPDGTERFSFFAYAPNFSGGVAVATGDLTGDGIDEIVTGAGTGGGPHVKVFDGATGLELASFFAYPEFGRGGVWVAVGDIDGDGSNDIVTGAGPGGGPHVKVFRFLDLSELVSFFAGSSEGLTGARVASADLDGDGFAEVIAAEGSIVRVYAGSGLELRSEFLGYDGDSPNGVFVAAADGLILVGSGPSAGVVNQFDADGNFLDQNIPGPDFAGGVASLDTANGYAVAAGPGAAPVVRMLQYNGTIIAEISAFEASFTGGIFVG